MNIEQLASRAPKTVPSRILGHYDSPLAAPASRAFARPGRLALLINRMIDIAISALLLVVLMVPMLLIAVLVKLTSRGPAMYRQERIGLGGKPFTILKFRTMRADAEGTTGPVWARRGDPRRTSLGILLRRLSLDELPQLFNILRGDMSLVGPRPERPFFVQVFSREYPAYNQRHQVRQIISILDQ